MEYTVRAGGLAGLPEIIRELGADPNEIFNKVGFNLSAFNDPDHKVSYKQILYLLNVATEVTGEQDFGLLLSQRQGFRILGTLGFTMKEAPDIRTALIDLCRYLKVHMSGAKICLEENDGLAIWSFAVTMPSAPNPKQQIDLSMGIGLGFMRRLISPKWVPEFAHVEYKIPNSTALQQKIFKCPISYNQEINAFMFDSNFLDMKIKSSNEELYHILKVSLNQMSKNAEGSFIANVRTQIMDDLQSGQCTVDGVAAKFSMKRRTFQRKLNSVGMNFTNILEETRIDMAKRFLSLSDISITQIGDMLGYADIASFSHSFKKNTQFSPKDWRARNLPK